MAVVSRAREYLRFGVPVGIKFAVVMVVSMTGLFRVDGLSGRWWEYVLFLPALFIFAPVMGYVLNGPVDEDDPNPDDYWRTRDASRARRWMLLVSGILFALLHVVASVDAGLDVHFWYVVQSFGTVSVAASAFVVGWVSVVDGGLRIWRWARRERSVHLPPGSRLVSVLTLLFGPSVGRDFIDPAYADLLHEWQEAEVLGDPLRVRRVVLRGRISMVAAAVTGLWERNKRLIVRLVFEVVRYFFGDSDK